MVSEVSDVQAHSGDVCIADGEVVVITYLYEGLCLQAMVSEGTRVEGVCCEALGILLELREWQLIWNEITHRQTV